MTRKNTIQENRKQTLIRLIAEMITDIPDEKIIERIYKFIRYYYLK